MSAVLDTDVVLYALQGALENGLPQGDLLISIITEIEVLAFSRMTPEQEERVREMLGRMRVVPLDESVKREAILPRRTTGLRLPDAIILASAIATGSELLTNDRKMTNAATMVVCRTLAVEPLGPVP